MNKKPEADITPKVMKWCQSKIATSCPLKIKHTGNSNNFLMSNLLQHQRDYLLAATTLKGMSWKIPDANIGYNPFDCIFYKNTRAYVAIVYPRWTFAIEIRKMLKIKTSINEDEAIKLARFTILTSYL